MNCCFYSEKVESGRDEKYRCSWQPETRPESKKKKKTQDEVD